ncbi:MAG: hypothetical protein ACI89X_002997 [Planctomycetota bacterium]|jgi:hypothetical protein
MARFALLILGVLMATAVWLWSPMDPAPIAPAMAFASAEHRGDVPPATSAATGTQVPASEAKQATQPQSSSVRTAVVASAKRYTIRGTVTRNGVGQPRREVVCSSGWGKKSVTTVSGRGGLFTFEVEPGEHELYAPHMVGTTQRQSAYSNFPLSVRDRVAAATASCTVKAADVALAMQLPVCALVVTFRNSQTFAPIPSATVTWRPPIPEEDELLVKADQGGRVRLSDVTLGTNTLVASARAFVGLVKEVEVVAGEPDQLVEFLLDPAGAVDVVMVDERRQAIAVSRALVIALHLVSPPAVLKVGYPGGEPVYPSNRKQFLSKERPLLTPFDHVFPGQYELHMDGDLYGAAGDESTVRFAPYIATGEHVIDVRLGELQRFELPVVQRSYATVRAVSQQGKLLNGTLRVTFQGSDGVWRLVHPAPWQHRARHAGAHFNGYLKSGTYALAFAMGDRVWREQLVVTELVVDCTLRLPW